MKLAVVLSLVPLSSAVGLQGRALLQARGDCHGNNCNRAVTGTREGLLPFSSRSADCSSFLLTTVTPAPTTTTVTMTITPSASTKHNPSLVNRQVTVTAYSIPEYAANCANGEEYKTACSCFGITGSVTTAPTPTVTVTATIEACEEEDWY
ncbi:hypothetical protein B0T16DRAFT_243805 [Cercophora newfieldiana]|uniref:Antifreeze protein n=1 Tax=Cercophora newfieldiana TaxID=92897 RepID=A0AA40CJ50_9PEZI|nr:hypothetical protein B0T16DRAFT_243805 [Cercophora newfieldiana]